jgi:hypothetical protein
VPKRDPEVVKAIQTMGAKAMDVGRIRKEEKNLKFW